MSAYGCKGVSRTLWWQLAGRLMADVMAVGLHLHCRRRGMQGTHFQQQLPPSAVGIRTRAGRRQVVGKRSSHRHATVTQGSGRLTALGKHSTLSLGALQPVPDSFRPGNHLLKSSWEGAGKLLRARPAAGAGSGRAALLLMMPAPGGVKAKCCLICSSVLQTAVSCSTVSPDAGWNHCMYARAPLAMPWQAGPDARCGVPAAAPAVLW